MSDIPRVPPYDRTAEAAVIGSVLLNNAALADVRGKVAEEDFYVETYRRIYQAILELATHGDAIDAVTIAAELKRRGDYDRVGGAMAIDGLTDVVVTTANVQHYVGIVQRKAARRRMIYAAQQIVAEGFAEAEEESEYCSNAQKVITAASQSFRTGDGPLRLDDDYKAIWNELQQPGDPPGLVKTGIDVIDRVTGGLWPSQLYVVGGRPSMGKTAFGLNLATNASLAGCKTLYVSMEDVRKFLALRNIARFADIDLHDLNLRRVKTTEQWRRVTDAVQRLAQQHPLWVEDSSGLTSATVAQIASAHYAMHGLDLVVLDHLGEFADTGESETSITTRATMRVRDIAKDLNIPVVLMCQLNRNVEARADKRPILSDLRQSGGIEQAGRNVWFLYRPAYYLPPSEAEGRHDLELLVAKASHSKTGRLKMWADMSRMYTRSWDESLDGLWPEDKGSGSVSGSPPPKKQNHFGSTPQPHCSDTDRGGEDTY